jgi:drug/metabolite transporter (DMT)-like permease
MYYQLIVEAGATRGSLITYVNPAVAVILGVVILSEPITLGTVVGFALIVVGCALATGVAQLRAPRPTRVAAGPAHPSTGSG